MSRNWVRKILYETYGITKSTIKRLQSLFDFNYSMLRINNTNSIPLHNKRGLLQGSSLSPMLFNFFVDPLLQKLNSNDFGKVTIQSLGLKSNALAFADDINLHSTNVNDMKLMLKACELWSLKVGMRFAPQKCLVLNNAKIVENELKIYGENLTIASEIKYLGIFFTNTGINWNSVHNERCKKALSVLMQLIGIGMNGGGFTPQASTRLYKTFIRPILEYGSQLKLFTDVELKPFSKIQKIALRAIMSASRNASINGLHKVLKIETIECRLQMLNAAYFGRLHNNTDSQIPAVKLYKSRNTLPTTTKPHSLITMFKKNKFYRKLVLPHAFTRITNQEIEIIALPKTMKQEIVLEHLQTLETSNRNVAGAIPVLDLKMNPLFTTEAHYEAVDYKKHRVAIQKWAVGGVANHQPCLSCQESQELSRMHALQCSGALQHLQTAFGLLLNNRTPEQVDNIDALSYLIHYQADKMAESANNIKQVYQGIALVYKNCLGYRVQTNGFWTNQTHEPVQGIG